MPESTEVHVGTVLVVFFGFALSLFAAYIAGTANNYEEPRIFTCTTSVSNITDSDEVKAICTTLVEQIINIDNLPTKHYLLMEKGQFELKIWLDGSFRFVTDE